MADEIEIRTVFGDESSNSAGMWERLPRTNTSSLMAT